MVGSTGKCETTNTHRHRHSDCRAVTTAHTHSNTAMAWEARTASDSRLTALLGAKWWKDANWVRNSPGSAHRVASTDVAVYSMTPGWAAAAA